MLPDLRAVIAAAVAALGLLMIAFGLAATVRVAQHDAKSPLEAAKGHLRTEIARREAVTIVAVPERTAEMSPALPAPGSEPPIASPLAAPPEPARPDPPPAAENPASDDRTASIATPTTERAPPVVDAPTIAPQAPLSEDREATAPSPEPTAVPPMGGPEPAEAARVPTRIAAVTPVVQRKKKASASKQKARLAAKRKLRARLVARRIVRPAVQQTTTSQSPFSFLFSRPAAPSR